MNPGLGVSVIQVNRSIIRCAIVEPRRPGGRMAPPTANRDRVKWAGSGRGHRKKETSSDDEQKRAASKPPGWDMLRYILRA
jgi:hypothetical protein